MEKKGLGKKGLDMLFFEEEKSAAFRRSCPHNVAVFSIDTGNRCSTFGLVKLGVNSEIMSILFTFSSIGVSF